MVEHEEVLMRSFLIVAAAAVLGMLFSSFALTLVSTNPKEASASSAVPVSDAELDAYISELIDQQLADVIEKRATALINRVEPTRP